MARKVRCLIALAVVALSLSGVNVASTAASPPQGGGECVDHVDNGIRGNIGDPGDGQENHNEDLGVGNHGDPGNGVGHYCPTE